MKDYEYLTSSKKTYWTPKLFTKFTQLQFFIKKKFLIFKKIFVFALFFLFFGFVFGNLFGTFLNKIRNFEIWDGFIVLFLIFIIEIINYFNYFNHLNDANDRAQLDPPDPHQPIEKSLNNQSLNNKNVNFPTKKEHKTNRADQSQRNFTKQIDPMSEANSSSSIPPSTSQKKTTIDKRLISPTLKFFKIRSGGSNSVRSNLWKFLNYFKIGLELGFFIDAFKVGS
uniref:Hypothetical chloroplast RF20 n=2 Tax=Ignatiaceae TaxID=2682551 RepID=A0A1W6EGY5_9CHLO|nr:hypothetical chloroplast RF20 [Pseudocharacium americanum]YP_009367705.1 hypothetical chloroplast RF20 [Ignatius tetrasporus]ARK14620.1 hypothetical chloroplast RF20 [Pseudocharacium americanum]ARK14709.1 hypothetical chloroplast RF20 [Ignatius tetrasporus]